MSAPIAIIGGGWAGCAAALTLAQHGHRVALYEASPVLGGRARCVTRHGLPLDNGQHLLLGAYSETLRMMALAHAPGAPEVARSGLHIAPLSATQRNGLSFAARAVRPPLGLLWGLLAARGIRFSERLATVSGLLRWKRRGWRCAPGMSVEQLLAELPAQVGEKLWAPLCLASLNTPVARASGQVFLNVLRAAFDSTPDAADLVLARENLSALFPNAVARSLARDGHAIHLRTTATLAAAGPGGVTLQTRAATVDAPGVIIAVGPHQLAHAVAERARIEVPELASAIAAVARLTYESITTVYLGYGVPITIGAGLVRLDDAPGQWVLDRLDILAQRSSAAASMATLVAVVISGNGPHDEMPHDDLVRACDAQLRRLRPGLPPCVWSQVIAEQRATYACTPQAIRPRSGAIGATIGLAGDYTDPEFPATLEAAVRSGRRAAEALIERLR